MKEISGRERKDADGVFREREEKQDKRQVVLPASCHWFGRF